MIQQMQWENLLNQRRLRPLSTSTKKEDDVRTAFDADFDRVVFSTPCRRLQDKAQVFPLEPIDAVRTRLTHSLEVSSVARGISKNVSGWLVAQDKTTPEQASSIVTIAATCGLLHDFGNPPFGHAGEDAVKTWFETKFLRSTDSISTGSSNGFLHEDLLKAENKKYLNDLLNFEGNAQTLRLVMSLQILSDEWGLDLSVGTLSAAMKYISCSESIDENAHSRKKLGVYQTEKEKATRVRELTGIERGRNPITLLVEAADDATYCAVDLEDGIKKGVVDWSVISERVCQLGQYGKNLISRTENRFVSSNLPGGSRAKEEYYVQYFRTLAIADAVTDSANKFKANYSTIMEGEFDGELLLDIDSETAALYGCLKGIGRDYVWNSKETIRLELLGRNVIYSLLDHFYDFDDNPKSKTFASKSYRLLSSSYRRVYESNDDFWTSLPMGYRRAILVTDYISGMTDTFAANLHRELSFG